MVTLNWWESFVVNAAIALLQELEAKLMNEVEKAALQSAIEFLQKLVGGAVAGTHQGK